MSDWMRKILYYENILEFKEKTKSSLHLDEVHHWNICRTCLKEIGEESNSSYLGLGGSSMNVLGLDVHLIQAKDMLKETTGVEITSSDRMPMRICKECLSKTSIFYLFKLQTKRSETVLRRMLAKLDESQAESERLKKCTSPREITVNNEDCTEAIIRVESAESLQIESPTLVDESVELRNTADLPSIKMETYGNSEYIECTIEREVNMVQIHEKYLEKDEIEGEEVPKDNMEEGKYEHGTQNLEISSLDMQSVDDHCSDALEGASEAVANAAITNLTAVDKLLLDNLICAVCNEVFPLLRMLRAHMRDAHPNTKAFKCRICHKMFTHLQSLSRHMQTHLSKRYKYVCNMCNQPFQRVDSFRRHLRIHTGERPHVCDVCSKGFKHASELKEHVGSHSTDRRFECSICGHCLLSRNDLDIHKKGHEGV